MQLAVEAVSPQSPNNTTATPWLAVTPPPPPVVPPALVTGLAGSRRNPHRNDLSWNVVGGALGYVVHRPTFSDTTAAPGASYYYRVAYLTPKGGESLPSDAVRLKTLIGGPPWLNPLVGVIPFDYNAFLTWIGHNDGTSFNVYSWYARTLFPLPMLATSLQLTASPGADGMTPWGARAPVPLPVILTPLPLPIWGCWSLKEVYPDGSESPPSLPACMAFPCP